MEIILNLEVNNQSITADRIRLVRHSENIYKCHFTFSEDWEGFGKTAQFKTELGTPISVVLDSDNECFLPVEALRGNYCYIGMEGTNDNPQLYPTVWTNGLFVEDGACQGEEHEEPTADVYQQIISLIEEGKLRGVGIASIEKTSTEGLVDTYTITFDDESTETFEVTNGFSPSASVSKVGSTATITITDKNGTTTAEISDGEKGNKGDKGDAGTTDFEELENLPTTLSGYGITDAYTKSEVDSALSEKVDSDDVPSLVQTNESVSDIQLNGTSILNNKIANIETVETISPASTHQQIPSTKAVVDYVDSAIGYAIERSYPNE